MTCSLELGALYEVVSLTDSQVIEDRFFLVSTCDKSSTARVRIPETDEVKFRWQTYIENRARKSEFQVGTYVTDKLCDARGVGTIIAHARLRPKLGRWIVEWPAGFSAVWARDESDLERVFWVPKKL